MCWDALSRECVSNVCRHLSPKEDQCLGPFIINVFHKINATAVLNMIQKTGEKKLQIN